MCIGLTLMELPCPKNGTDRADLLLSLNIPLSNSLFGKILGSEGGLENLLEEGFCARDLRVIEKGPGGYVSVCFDSWDEKKIRSS